MLTQIGKNYQNFFNGRYFAEGVRMTFGVVIPAFVLGWFGMLNQGLVLSFGALCVSITDQPGPVRHRFNGMLAGLLLCGPVSFLVHLTGPFPIWLGVLLAVAGFVFSMLSIYGNRLASIGIASLVIMVLSMQAFLGIRDALLNSAFLMLGGMWYMLYSLLLYQLKPYKFLQQLLGDLVISISGYLRLRARFYSTTDDIENTFRKLSSEQVEIEKDQQMLSEMIFKTRTILRESTVHSRALLNMYVNVSDLFESIMTTYNDYRVMHEQIGHTGILKKFREFILLFADQLRNTGVALKSGEKAEENEEIGVKLKELRILFEELRRTEMKNEQVEVFISLGRILRNMEEMAERLRSIHYYSGYDKRILRSRIPELSSHDYVKQPGISPSLFFNNFNFHSNVFRYSLRMAIALVAGFIIGNELEVGHSYWILLTIIVILKPAYSLSKKRNTDRLIGTLAGLVLGIAILVVIKNERIELGFLVLCMIAANTFLRTNYFISVLFMTAYMLIFFNLLFPGNILNVITDRMIDTAIGSAIAFLASLFIAPVWEHVNIKALMIESLRKNNTYFTMVASQFLEEKVPDINSIKKAKQESLVAQANLSDAFNRMLSEPKRFQKGIKPLHRFVVLNHTLMSHLASLSYFLRTGFSSYRSRELLPVIENIRAFFNNSENCLEGRSNLNITPNKGPLKLLMSHADQLLEARKNEINQGLLETPTKNQLVEIKSITDQFSYIYNLASAIQKNCMEADSRS